MEVSNRINFYQNVFGNRIKSPTFPPKLWPVINYDEKIRGLTERGFKDPQKMITSLPTILGLSFENIDEKIRKARLLRVKIDDFIAYTVIFIGMSSKHYVPILRACRLQTLEPTATNVFKIYKNRKFKRKDD